MKDYIAQMMFNSPPGLSDAMDLAKMLAVLELIEPLGSDNFRIWKQTRTGLLSYPLDPDAARGHLAASIYLQMALKPHIVHIVGHTEAHHAATAEDVIEASKMARRAIENALRGAPDMTADPQVQARENELVTEASNSPWKPSDRWQHPAWTIPGPIAATLAAAVTSGILDAPQLNNNRFGRGSIRTRIVNGMCLAVDTDGHPLSEENRLSI